MTTETIYVNIWDDFFDDGFLEEGEIQETYAYVECDLEVSQCKDVLSLLKDNIESLIPSDSPLELSVYFYDSAQVYPNLVGTEHEQFLYKRWQLGLKHITHEALENLVPALQKLQLKFNDIPLKIYSES